MASFAAGIVLSFLVLQVFGPSTLALTIALLAGLALARLPWVRHEGTLIATTALFVITTGEQQSQGAAIDVLPDRLLDTALGVGVALAVNLLVVPPLDDRSAQEQVDRVNRRLEELLTDMASESPSRRRAPGMATGSSGPDPSTGTSTRPGRSSPSRTRAGASTHAAACTTTAPRPISVTSSSVWRKGSQAPSIASHILETRRAGLEWHPGFRDRYLPLLAALGRSVAEPEGRRRTPATGRR